MLKVALVFIFLLANLLIAQDENQTAVISVQPQEWDVGKVPANQLLSKKFTLKNDGNATLTISVIRPSSEDISFSLDSFQIQAKKSSELQLSFRAPSIKGAFRKFVIIESNDKSKPILKIEIKGDVIEGEITQKESIYFFYSEENDETKNIFEQLAKLEKSHKIPFKTFSIEDPENYKILREFENKHKLTRGASMEMFYLNKYFLGSTQIMFAIGALSEGKSIDEVINLMTGITFDHKHTPKTKTTVTQGTAIYQPLILDVFFEADCNECVKSAQKNSEKLANKFKKRLRIRFPDMKNQETRTLLMNILDVEKFPEHSSFVLVVGGRFFIGGEEVFDEIEKFLDITFSGATSGSQVLRSDSYTSEIIEWGNQVPNITKEVTQPTQKSTEKSKNGIIVILTALSSTLSLISIILLVFVTFYVLKRK